MDCVRNYLTSKEPCVHASQSRRDASFIVESATGRVGDRAQVPDRNRTESCHEQYDRGEGVAKGNSDERAAAALQVRTVRSSLCAAGSSRTASVGDSRREEEEGRVTLNGRGTLTSCRGQWVGPLHRVPCRITILTAGLHDRTTRAARSARPRRLAAKGAMRS